MLMGVEIGAQRSASGHDGLASVSSTTPEGIARIREYKLPVSLFRLAFRNPAFAMPGNTTPWCGRLLPKGTTLSGQDGSALIFLSPLYSE